MPACEFRLYFNNNPATREQLDRVEEITVEQEMDLAWEARLQIPLCVDEHGNWRGGDEDVLQPFSRLRVEVKVGDRPFVPLIDGPVVSHDHDRSAQPGQSTLTLVVQDDSFYLNRQEVLVQFTGRADDKIATDLFQIPQIAATDIDPTPAAAGSRQPVTVQRGSAIQVLRSLARRQGMHVYVLAGPQPGQSVGCFKELPTALGDLPPLILLGPERNIESFKVVRDAALPAMSQAFALDISNKTVLRSKSRFQDLNTLGPEPTIAREADTATLVSLPFLGDTVDLDRRVAAEAARANYNLEATGQVMATCYSGVLQPYRVVSVRGVDDRLSGNYLITKVTHTLNRSQYSQSFAMKRNALSAGAASKFSDAVGRIC
jgi:hypothetical protein